MISLRPSVFAATAIMAARARSGPPWRNLQVGGVQPDISAIAGQWAVRNSPTRSSMVLAQLRDGALRDAAQPHRLHQLVHPGGSRTPPPIPSLLNDGDQGLLGGLCAAVEEAGKVAARAAASAPQVQSAQTGVDPARRYRCARVVRSPRAPCRPGAKSDRRHRPHIS